MTTNDNLVDGLSIQEILDYLPHRFPFLLIDRVLSYEPHQTLTALKNVSVNEPCFTGHFPDRPILPGVLILEAMAQASGILSFVSMDRKADGDSLYLFVGVDNARFRKQVTPGDQLRLVVDLVNEKRGIWKFDARAYVGEDVVCGAQLMSAHRPL